MPSKQLKAFVEKRIPLSKDAKPLKYRSRTSAESRRFGKPVPKMTPQQRLKIMCKSTAQDEGAILSSPKGSTSWNLPDNSTESIPVTSIPTQAKKDVLKRKFPSAGDSVKLSELTMEKRLEIRAKRFGEVLTADAAKLFYTERFANTSPAPPKPQQHRLPQSKCLQPINHNLQNPFRQPFYQLPINYAQNRQQTGKSSAKLKQLRSNDTEVQCSKNYAV